MQHGKPLKSARRRSLRAAHAASHRVALSVLARGLVEGLAIAVVELGKLGLERVVCGRSRRGSWQASECRSALAGMRTLMAAC